MSPDSRIDRLLRLVRAALSSWAGIIALLVVLGSVIAVFVAYVPVEREVRESYSIVNPGVAGFGTNCVYGPGMTVPRSGSLDFAWQTNDSKSAQVGLVNVSASFLDWENVNSNGSGSVWLVAGNLYAFWFCTGHPETLLVSVTLFYAGPLV
jgi:hypothetical protein